MEDAKKFTRADIEAAMRQLESAKSPDLHRPGLCGATWELSAESAKEVGAPTLRCNREAGHEGSAHQTRYVKDGTYRVYSWPTPTSYRAKRGPDGELLRDEHGHLVPSGE